MNLTPTRIREINKLARDMCANYDSGYKICMLKDKPCPMLDKDIPKDEICTYLRDSVLPLNPLLEAAVLRKMVESKECVICGNRFAANGRQLYCSDKCERQGNKIKSRARVQRMRENRA